MSSRLQVFLAPEAMSIVENIIKEANDNFSAGRINYSHVLTELVLNSKVDIKALQLKHTDWRRCIRSYSADEQMDLETVLKNLNELRSVSAKRKSKPSPLEDMKDE